MQQGSPAKASALGFCSGPPKSRPHPAPAPPPWPFAREGRPEDRYTSNDDTSTHSHSSPAGYYDDYDEDELGSEPADDDTYDLDGDGLAVALEMSVKEMALGDWMRGRILDGACLASGDVYFRKQGGLENPELGVRAVHPVSWSISTPSSPPSTTSSVHPTAAASAPAPATPERHPGPSPLRRPHTHSPRPRTARTSRTCAPSSSPSSRTSRNARADEEHEREQERGQERGQEREREMRYHAERSDDSSAGTPHTSDTSPVLSTSTQETTLSPPPLRSASTRSSGRTSSTPPCVEEREIKPTFLVSPVLNPPRLLRPFLIFPKQSRICRHIVWMRLRRYGAKLAHLYITAGAPSASARWQAAQGGNVSKATASPTTTTISVPPAPTSATKENKETPRENDNNGGSLSRTTGYTSGAATTARTAMAGGADPARAVLAAVVEDVGPGAWMELMDEMTSRKLKTPYIAEGAFLMGGGLPVEATIPQRRPAARDATIVRTALAFLDKVVTAAGDPNSLSICGTLAAGPVGSHSKSFPGVRIALDSGRGVTRAHAAVAAGACVEIGMLEQGGDREGTLKQEVFIPPVERARTDPRQRPGTRRVDCSSEVDMVFDKVSTFLHISLLDSHQAVRITHLGKLDRLTAPACRR
ncbi:hypothetical protein B0H14DRAFT_2649500 [Mycena olivaceomarginata]|nr:hypothetical protein B0H14DRAFT_2649500 [Mycena olivaceomarginata]